MFLNKHKLILLHTVKWFQVFLCITNNSIKHQLFVCTQLNDQTVLFLTIQFSINHLFIHSLMSKFYLTLSGATTPGQSGPMSNGNEEVLCFPQSFSIIRASPSDYLVSYPGHSLRDGVLFLYRDAVGLFYSPSWLR